MSIADELIDAAGGEALVQKSGVDISAVTKWLDGIKPGTDEEKILQAAISAIPTQDFYPSLARGALKSLTTENGNELSLPNRFKTLQDFLLSSSIQSGIAEPKRIEAIGRLIIEANKSQGLQLKRTVVELCGHILESAGHAAIADPSRYLASLKYDNYKGLSIKEPTDSSLSGVVILKSYPRKKKYLDSLEGILEGIKNHKVRSENPTTKYGFARSLIQVVLSEIVQESLVRGVAETKDIPEHGEAIITIKPKLKLERMEDLLEFTSIMQRLTCTKMLDDVFIFQTKIPSGKIESVTIGGKKIEWERLIKDPLALLKPLREIHNEVIDTLVSEALLHKQKGGQQALRDAIIDLGEHTRA